MTDAMRPRRARRRAPFLALLPAFAVVAVACGVPTGEGTFEPIAADEVSPALAAEATTTTTTTTTVPEIPVTTIATTTTMSPETFETLDIYFLTRGLLRPVELTVAAPVLPTDVIDLLEAGPPDSVASTIDTAVPEGLVNDLEISAGVVTIDLSEAEFDGIARRDQQRAIAQMVFTFVLNLQGVGQALFTLDGSRIAVPRGDNRLTLDPVSVDDYANLLADQPVVVGTTSTTTTIVTTTQPAVEPTQAEQDTSDDETAAPTTTTTVVDQ